MQQKQSTEVTFYLTFWISTIKMPQKNNGLKTPINFHKKPHVDSY
jgi:hypothetical protein